MKRTVLSILLCVTLSVGASGCVLHGDARGVAYGVDAMVIAGGAAMMTQKGESSGCEDAHGYCWDFDPTPAIGGLMVLGGTIAMLLTLMINAGDDDEKETKEKKDPKQPPARPWMPLR
jgi:hypothetical protein